MSEQTDSEQREFLASVERQRVTPNQSRERTEEEIAREIVQKHRSGALCLPTSIEDDIVAAIRTARTEGRAQGRVEGIEEAAKVADRFEKEYVTYWDDPSAGIAATIRALVERKADAPPRASESGEGRGEA